MLRGALGEKLAQEFIKLKRMEWIEYSRHVSDWETQSVPGVLLMCGIVGLLVKKPALRERLGELMAADARSA